MKKILAVVVGLFMLAVTGAVSVTPASASIVSHQGNLYYDAGGPGVKTCNHWSGTKQYPNCSPDSRTCIVHVGHNSNDECNYSDNDTDGFYIGSGYYAIMPGTVGHIHGWKKISGCLTHPSSPCPHHIKVYKE